MTSQPLEQYLAGIDDPTVDHALAAALDSCDTDACRWIADLLLKRQHPEGTLGLVLHYHRMPPEVKARIVAHVSELFRPLREAASHEQGRGPLNAMTIIAQALNPRLAYLLSEQLRQRDPDRRERAAAALLKMAERAASDPLPGTAPAISPEDHAYLHSAIEEAIQRYSRHRDQRLLKAAAWLLPRPIPALEQLADNTHPAAREFQKCLREPEHPAFQRAALLLVDQPQLQNHCLRGLDHAVRHGCIDQVLAYHHLADLPRRRHVMRAHSRLNEDWPGDEQRRRLPVPAQRGLASWAWLLPGKPGQRLERLGSLASLSDPLARLSGLRRLIRIATSPQSLAEPAQGEPDDVPDEPLHEAVAAFCHDDNPHIARLALRFLIARNEPNLVRRLTELLRSPHPDIRRLAAEQLAPLGFARLWEMWPKLDEQRRLGAAQALLKLDTQFHRLLGQKLRSRQRGDRLRALNMIATLQQGPHFEAQLIELCRHEDEKLAAAAVSALGPVTTKTARAAIEQSMNHADTRVRANAVEALSENDAAEHVQTLLAMSEPEEANRPRANALKVLLEMRTDQAMKGLSRMLMDDRPEHRASALWLVETGGVLSLAQHVAEMARQDQDEQIRDRAGSVIRQLAKNLQKPAERPEAAAG